MVTGDRRSDKWQAAASITAPPPLGLGPPSSTEGRPRGRGARSAVALAAVMSSLGWLAWLFGWFVETDTGYPDGLACTAHPPDSDAYVSCLEYSERVGAVVWAVTLLLAVGAVILLARAWLGAGRGVGLVVVGVLVSLMAASLAAAGVMVWIDGARGALYEGRIGAASWHLFNVLAVLVGAGGGWLLARWFTESSRSRRSSTAR